MKRLLLFQRFFAAVLLLTASTMSWADDFVKDGICYNINIDGVSVSVANNTSNRYSGSIVIPATVTYGEMEYSVTGIGSGAFSGCYDLTSVTIPHSVTTIYDKAFLNCIGLTSITIPDGVKYIQNYAFYGCSNLTSIIFCNTLEYIDSGALTNSAWYNNQPDGLVYAGTVAYKYKGTMPESTQITIKGGTLAIADYAFKNCIGLTSVTIPNSTISIGAGAFSYTNLCSFNIPESVTRIGAGAFDGTPWYINQPAGTVYAGKFVYRYNWNMGEGTHITIIDGTLGIADQAFYRCSGLTSVTIPNSVSNIGSEAFKYCGDLTSVTIPNSVKNIASGTFLGCSNLKEVIIPNTVEIISEEAFRECSALTSVTIPESVTNIGSEAFRSCIGMTSVTIPGNMKIIGSNAFSGCSGLTKSEFASLESLCNIIFVNGVANPLYYSKHLYIKGQEITDLIIPNSVTNLLDYTFNGCAGLISVIIPNSVIKIGNNTFDGCEGLTSVTFGNSMKSIGYGAFSGCMGITTVICPTIEVPTTGYNCFMNVPRSSATLYVPESSINAYQSTYPWNFGTVLPIAECITGDANGNGEVEIGDVTSVLTLMATPEATGYNNEAADANGNGEIEIGDVTTILTIMATGGK